MKHVKARTPHRIRRRPAFARTGFRWLAPIAAAALLAALTAYAATRAGAPVANERVRHDMVRFEGGTYAMGSGNGHDDERPVHEVWLDPFRIDRHEVTNRQFAAFVEATGHVTQAEQDGYAWGFLDGDTDFRKIAGASWRRPGGPGTSYEKRLDHPVVCVTWHDAVTYASWADKRLPTEAEWEFAARGGGRGQLRADPQVVAEDGKPDGPAGGSCPFGRCTPDSRPAARGLDAVVDANVWNGRWPTYRRPLRGSPTTTPAGSFAANAAGLVDVIGNVWEWTADWYAADYYAASPRENPRGPAAGERRVARGGSWFCSPAYCAAYTTHYRGASPPDRAFTNVGFRCAADAQPDRESGN